MQGEIPAVVEGRDGALPVGVPEELAASALAARARITVKARILCFFEGITREGMARE
jgi:hypothetical protein